MWVRCYCKVILDYRAASPLLSIWVAPGARAFSFSSHLVIPYFSVILSRAKNLKFLPKSLFFGTRTRSRMKDFRFFASLRMTFAENEKALRRAPGSGSFDSRSQANTAASSRVGEGGKSPQTPFKKGGLSLPLLQRGISEGRQLALGATQLLIIERPCSGSGQGLVNRPTGPLGAALRARREAPRQGRLSLTHIGRNAKIGPISRYLFGRFRPAPNCTLPNK